LIRNTNAITVSCYLSMLFLGVAMATVAAAARTIGLTPYQIGLLLGFQNIGFAFSVALSGALADVYHKTRIMLVGAVVLALAFLTFYRVDLFWVNCLVMLAIGAGAGAFEGVSDAILFEIHPTKPALYININHFFVNMGGLAIALYLVFLAADRWRMALVQSGIAVLLLAVFFALARVPDRPGRRREGLGDKLRLLTRERLLAVLFLVTALGMGVKTAGQGVLTTFLVEARDFNSMSANLGLVVFLGGLGFGRVLVGLFTRREQMPRYLALLLAASAVLYGMLYFVDLGLFTWALLFGAGFAFSGLLPLALTLGALTYPHSAGTAMGVIKVGIPAGGMAVPFAMSLLSESAGFHAALWLLPAGYIIGLLLFVATGFLAWRPPAAQPA
jgi:predicted MFS family arabinose efflux permease